MLGDCTSPGQISRGDVKAITCTVIIPASADPGTEPQFTVELSAEQISVNDTVTMLVASTKELTWEIDLPATVKTGETNSAQLTITNIGNAPVSGKLDLSSSKGWDIEVEGLDTINLEAGQSQQISLSIMANEPGDGTFSATLSNVGDVQGSQFDWDVTSEGEVVADDSSSKSNALLWSVSVIFILILAGFAVLVMKKNKRSNVIKSVPLSAPDHSAFPETVSPESITPCFSCRQPILSWMMGCPSCGARYHSVRKHRQMLIP